MVMTFETGKRKISDENMYPSNKYPPRLKRRRVNSVFGGVERSLSALVCEGLFGASWSVGRAGHGQGGQGGAGGAKRKIS